MPKAEHDSEAGESEAGEPPPLGSVAEATRKGGGGTAAGSRCALGILCVHGMGRQRRGDTVASITRALKDSEKLQPIEAVSVDSASLKETQLAAGDPAHARLTVKAGDEAARWLVAETWWADDFEAPSTATLGWWMLGRGSMAVVAHLSGLVLLRLHRLLELAGGHLVAGGAVLIEAGAGLRKAGGGKSYPTSSDGRTRTAPLPDTPALSVLYAFGWLVLWILVGGPLFLVVALIPTVLLQLLTLVLMVLALAPIEKLRAAIGSLFAVLRSVLGDGLQFTMSPPIKASIRTHLHGDLGWLLARCDKVVVLGHSQGAAVAYDGLASLDDAGIPDEDRARIGGFVSYGSGLEKLELLSESSLPLLLLGLTAPLYLVAALPLIRSTLPFSFESIFPAALLAAPALVAPWLAWKYSREVLRRRRRLREAYLSSRLPNPPWTDIRSTHDPVPTPTKARTFGVRDEIVDNFRSLLLDHSAYWANRDQFVPVVLADLAEHSGQELLAHRLWEMRERGGGPRRKRLGVLTLARALLGVCALVLVVFRPEPVVGALGESVAALGRWLPPTLRPGGMTVPVEWLGAAGVVVVALACYWLLFGAWRLWNAAESARLASRRRRTVLDWVSLVPLALAVAVPLTVVGALWSGASWPGRLWPLTRYLGSVSVLILVAAAVALFVLCMLAVLLLQLRRARTSAQSTGDGRE